VSQSTTLPPIDWPGCTAADREADAIRSREIRERARATGADKLFAPTAPVGTTSLIRDLALVADAQPPGDGTWEPECITCRTPMGVKARVGYYPAGLTQCAKCKEGSLDDRLRASGISFREINQPLAALRDHDPDGKPYGPEYSRYLEYLGRFAALKPGERMDPPFAFVYGSNGVGKSAGAERALRDAIRNGCSGRVVRMRDLLRHVTSTYGRSRDDVDERTDAVMRLYSSVHLLVIHEVGMEDPTEHNYGLFFDFVDGRWAACLPTIFDSNYSPDDDSLGAQMMQRTDDSTKMNAILDRIMGGLSKDGAPVNLFPLKGKSWRGRETA
jgi:hypothetical protein